LGRCAAASVALAAPCVTTAQSAFCEDLEQGAVCVPRLATGKPCDDDEQCAASAFCNVLTLDELALEVGACAPRIAAGGRCDPRVGGSVDGLACDEASELCAAIPDSAGVGCVADGQRTMPQLTTVALGEWADVPIKFDDGGMSLSVNGIEHSVRGSLGVAGWVPVSTWLLRTAYFGRDEKAPHTMHIDVRSIVVDGACAR